MCVHMVTGAADAIACHLCQVDAGGDVVVTQLFYDVEVFLQFVKDCHSVGITVPIVPGVQTWLPTCFARFAVHDFWRSSFLR